VPGVLTRTREQLEERRRSVLERTRVSEEELRRRAASYQLSVEEADALREIDEIDFLLGR
jgi:hypothetical protein